MTSEQFLEELMILGYDEELAIKCTNYSVNLALEYSLDEGVLLKSIINGHYQNTKVEAIQNEPNITFPKKH